MGVSVKRELVQAGIDYDCPADGAECLLTVIEDEKKFFHGKQEVTLTLGEAASDESLALEQAIMKMRQGEVTRISLDDNTFVLRLETFNNGLKVYEMSTNEKWRLANWHKDSGVDLFRQEKTAWAFRRFSLALKYLVSLAHDVPQSELDNEDMNINHLRMLLYLNMSACQIGVENWEYARDNASKALSFDQDNSKALFRRGTAFIYLQEYEKAEEDLRKALALEPSNPTIEQTLASLKTKMSSLDSKYAAAMGKMFG